MKKYLFLIIALIAAQLSFAQTQPVYLNKSGKVTDDPKQAEAYLIVNKIADNKGYIADQYDMDAHPMISGTYADAALTVPDGKFVFYKTEKASDNRLINYKSSVDYFANGKRNGQWIDYDSRGQVITEYTYADGKLNGAYKKVDLVTVLCEEGTMANGSLDGSYKIYTSDKLLAAEAEYKEGKKIKESVYLQAARQRANIKHYLKQKLMPWTRWLIDVPVTFSYNINQEGKITDVKVLSNMPKVLNERFVTALNGLFAYKPAMYNDKPVDEKMSLSMVVFSNQDYALEQQPLPSY